MDILILMKVKNMIWVIIACVLLPSAFADIAVPDPGMVATMGAVIIVFALLINYVINFAISFPLSSMIANVRAGKIAKGLLIITPIMLIFEFMFIGILEPRMLEEIFATWLFSFVLIFSCYFTIGKNMWEMNALKASIVGVIMAIITNPAYITVFF